MKTLIAVPMKEPTQSKTRLANRLSTEARARLACLLYRRTLAFLSPIAERMKMDLAVVTASGPAANIARAEGVKLIAEPENSDLSAAIDVAAKWANRRGYDRLCIIPADLVAPLEQDIVRLLESDARITICPSQDMGTNAMLISPPNAISFHYGDRSAWHHQKAAEENGLTPVLMPLESLKFDLDTSECLQRAMAQVPQIEAVCQ